MQSKSDGISLAPLDLPGEAFRRKAALARIEKLLLAEAYVEAVDAFSLTDDGTITFLYQSWAHDDDEALYEGNLMSGTQQGRDYVRDFVLDGEGEAIFQIHFRTIDGPTAPIL